MHTPRKLVTVCLIGITTVMPLLGAPAMGGNGLGAPAMGGIVTGAGARVNGTALADPDMGATLTPGDVVSAGAPGETRLALGDTRMVLAAGASARLETASGGNLLRLLGGRVDVQGGAPVLFGGFTTVAAPNAVYNVIWNDGFATVSATSGELHLKAPGRSLSVEPGRTVSFEAPAASEHGGKHAVPILLVALAIGVLAGIWVHEATRCSHCISY